MPKSSDSVGGLKKGLLIGVLAGAALSLVVLLTVLFTRPAPKDSPSSSAMKFKAGEPSDLSVYDFVIPDGIGDFLSPKPSFFREPSEAWSSEEIEEFWEDPRKAALEYLSGKNRSTLEDIFRGVP